MLMGGGGDQHEPTEKTGLGVNLGVVGEESKYDQNMLYEILKELIKIF